MKKYSAKTVKNIKEKTSGNDIAPYLRIGIISQYYIGQSVDLFSRCNAGFYISPLREEIAEKQRGIQ
jgi:hypothetical protein